jgi:hypothetical protein
VPVLASSALTPVGEGIVMNNDLSWVGAVYAFVFCGVGLVVLRVIVGIALRERPDPVTRARGFEVLPPRGRGE